MQRQVIEYRGLPVGVAIPTGDKLRFIAVKFHVIGLEDLQFSSVADLKSAIRHHLAERRTIAA
jgi:hypothetical protein